MKRYDDELQGAPSTRFQTYATLITHGTDSYWHATTDRQESDLLEAVTLPELLEEMMRYKLQHERRPAHSTDDYLTVEFTPIQQITLHAEMYAEDTDLYATDTGARHLEKAHVLALEENRMRTEKAKAAQQQALATEREYLRNLLAKHPDLKGAL